MEQQKKGGKQSFRVCFCFRRIFKLRLPEPLEDIKKVFDKYSENGTMSIDHLHQFMVEYQGEKNATKEDAQATFNSLNHVNIFLRKGLHLEAFFRHLLSDLNPPISPSLGVHHDMSAPLSHYYLYTGHNSYLKGNQLSSDSSVIPIIKALKKGVRVIELDLWPNSSNDDVDVCHGGTLTSPVELIKCLQAIKDYAFVASEYPVVITFEDHLTPSLQAKVAKMVTKTFGPTLFCPESDLKEFPSPESLKKMIMISTKPPKEYLETQNESQKLKNAAEEDDIWGDWYTEPKYETKTTFKDDTDTDDEEYHQEEKIDNAAPEYKRLIAIHAGKLKGGLPNWLSIDPNKVRRLSLSEQELEDAVKTNGTDIIRFTQRNLLRIYPKGTRFDSSNYNPMVGWTHGAQMVAFNMQGYGKHLWAMHGMFKANGGCGYVKKPKFLLTDGQGLLPVKKNLKVKVCMGEGWHSDFRHTHFDLYSPPDFYTRIGIVGAPADTIMRRTKAIEDEWIPVWNEEFEFIITVPELALLRIEVLEYDASGSPDFGGQTCLPISELRNGIRAVPLHNKKGEKYKSVRLLMRFEFNE